MPFSELQGQDRAVASLRAALRRGALHHAYLFGGPEGAGKGTAARLVAQAVNCERTKGEAAPAEEAGSAGRRAEAQPEHPIDAGGMGGAQRSGGPTIQIDDPCGECGPCRKIARGVHPDVFVLREERAMVKAGAWEAKGGRTPSKDVVVDQVRDLVDRRLSMKRYEGRRRVVVVDPADAMNVQAQNALLKTLEEPPDETTLVLVATNPDALLPTIRSRCVRVAFAPRGDGGVRELVERARLPRRKGEAAEPPTVVEAAAGLDPSNAGTWIAFAATFGDERERARERCELLALWLRDVLAAQAAGDAAPLALPEHAGATRRLAAAISPAEALRRREHVEEARRSLLQNAGAALALERMLIGWFHG
jgi:DNA polymerase-3 subunit delta'